MGRISLHRPHNPHAAKNHLLLPSTGVRPAPNTAADTRYVLNKQSLDSPLLPTFLAGLWQRDASREHKQVGRDPAFPGGYSLSCELVGPHGDAVDELHGTPQPVEFHTLVDVHDAVGGWRAPPDGVLQVASNAGQDNLEHG